MDFLTKDEFEQFKQGLGREAWNQSNKNNEFDSRLKQIESQETNFGFQKVLQRVDALEKEIKILSQQNADYGARIKVIESRPKSVWSFR